MKKRFPKRAAAIALPLIIALAALTGCQNPASNTPSGKPPPGPPKGEPGDAFSVKPRYDIMGREITDESPFNPLKNMAPNAVAEIYMAGINFGGISYNGSLYRENFTSSAFAYESTSSSNWEQLPKQCIAADIDGDGYDEIVILAVNTAVTENLTVRTVKLDASGSQMNLIAERSFRYVPIDTDTGHTLAKVIEAGFDVYTSLAAGDLDGDGKDEVLLYVMPHLYVLDDNLTELRTQTYAWGDCIALATADYDLDGKYEYVRAKINGPQSVEVKYYRNGHSASPVEIKSVNLDSGYGSAIGIAAATYDLDDNGLMDTIVIVRKGLAWETPLNYFSHMSDSCFVVTTSADISKHEPVFSSPQKQDSQEKPLKNPRPSLAVAKGEYYNGFFKVLIATECGTFVWLNENGGWLWDNLNEPVIYELDAWNGNARLPVTGPLFAADINGDGFGDFIAIRDGKMTVRLSSAASAKAETVNYTNTDYTLDANDRKYPALCLPNVDSRGTYARDSMVFKRLIAHELLFTRPQILAVLVSPPYWAGSSNRAGGTSYGTRIGHSSSESHAVGFSAGVAIGAEFDLLPFGKGKIQATVEGGFHHTWETTVSVTESLGDSIATGEDMVIFSATAYDVYYYEVTEITPAQNVSNPPAAVRDEIISFAFPRESKIYSFERGLYNTWIQKSIDAGLDTDADKNYFIPSGAAAGSIGLGHTLGNPRTYPTLANRNTFAGNNVGFYTKQSNTRVVGTADGGTLDLGLEQEITSSTTWDWNTAIGTQSEVSGGFFKKVSINTYWKAEYEGSKTTSYSTGTYIDGQIPTISTSYWTSHQDSGFSAGLMCYPVADKNQQYVVVTYWTEFVN